MQIIPFTNKKIKKIVNVYYKHPNETVFGIGDFLRGCFCLLQLCKKLNLEFDIYIKITEISSFIFPNSNEEKYKYVKNINEFGDMNHIGVDCFTYKTDSFNFYNKVIKMLNLFDAERTQNTFFVRCNSFPMWKLNPPIIRKIISSKIFPNKDMQKYIESTLLKLGLFRQQFGIVHVRTGDKYLVNSEKTPLQFAETIKNVLKPNISLSKKYLIISDNNELKLYLKKYFNFYAYFLPICHLGQSDKKSTESLKNTMLDLFIMKYSSIIISISPHNWGSGFSQWSAEMYNIPYKKIIFKI